MAGRSTQSMTNTIFLITHRSSNAVAHTTAKARKLAASVVTFGAIGEVTFKARLFNQLTRLSSR